MKQFIVDRHTTPNTPTLEQVPTEKVPIYETVAAAEADLANLNVGQIIGTPDTGNELLNVTDTVQAGNMHAVTSNAVAGGFTLSAIDPLDGTGISHLTLATTNQTAPYNGFITIGNQLNTAFIRELYINDILVGGVVSNGSETTAVQGFTYPINKGDTFRVNAACNIKSARWYINQH